MTYHRKASARSLRPLFALGLLLLGIVLPFASAVLAPAKVGGAAALSADYNGVAAVSHVRDKLVEMAHLNETEVLVHPPGRVVVIEVVTEKRRDAQSRTGFDHPLFQQGADPALLIGVGDVCTDFGGGVVSRPAGVKG